MGNTESNNEKEKLEEILKDKDETYIDDFNRYLNDFSNRRYKDLKYFSETGNFDARKDAAKYLMETKKDDKFLEEKFDDEQGELNYTQRFNKNIKSYDNINYERLRVISQIGDLKSKRDAADFVLRERIDFDPEFNEHVKDLDNTTDERLKYLRKKGSFATKKASNYVLTQRGNPYEPEDNENVESEINRMIYDIEEAKRKDIPRMEEEFKMYEKYEEENTKKSEDANRKYEDLNLSELIEISESPEYDDLPPTEQDVIFSMIYQKKSHIN